MVKKLSKYRENNTKAPWVGEKKAAIKNKKTCNLAEQSEKGMTNMVKNLISFVLMILVPINAGTLHPKPINIMTKARPSNPIFSIILSIKKAALEK